jgi:hypothetical protein
MTTDMRAATDRFFAAWNRADAPRRSALPLERGARP